MPACGVGGPCEERQVFAKRKILGALQRMPSNSSFTLAGHVTLNKLNDPSCPVSLSVSEDNSGLHLIEMLHGLNEITHIECQACARLMYNTLYEFPTAATTYYHRLAALKQQDVILSQWRPEV